MWLCFRLFHESADHNKFNQQPESSTSIPLDRSRHPQRILYLSNTHTFKHSATHHPHPHDATTISPQDQAQAHHSSSATVSLQNLSYLTAPLLLPSFHFPFTSPASKTNCRSESRSRLSSECWSKSADKGVTGSRWNDQRTSWCKTSHSRSTRRVIERFEHQRKA
jgi:hypothetical protein